MARLATFGLQRASRLGEMYILMTFLHIAEVRMNFCWLFVLFFVCWFVCLFGWLIVLVWPVLALSLIHI